ncbi:glycoside hydrolase family 31 protein [Pedobacter sp. BS3]|uniref:glycoside hydrolase family 31 protein n=1 Tax=Pedobacter sp. BS3 TaxID=2567937 RepID=UPI001F5B5CC6|nr:glycoside hydrolase family 31 protein [Pedobacter sp. BS3]
MPDLVAQERIIQLSKEEKWFGGAVNEAHLMPFKNGYNFDLYGNTGTNQAAPLLVSTKGKFIWSEEPFRFTIRNNQLIISNSGEPVVVDSSGKNLREAYLNASKRFFPSKGKLPDTLLFTSPQYNTWIELVYNQNQKDIIAYAKAIIANGFPPGVIMIDDNWADYYGRFDFRADRFNDAAGMVDTLHRMGFKVMLWISPFISPDTEVFRELQAKKYLLYDGASKKAWSEADKIAIINWWNGYSAVMDFTNPDAEKWFHNRLEYMVKTYHLDGFKFDAGDADFYPKNAISFKPATPNEHSLLWGRFGKYYPLNEYRAMWKMGGEPLVQRLRDKKHSWEDLQKLIPHITTAGLLGYQFTCPDMIGGGEYGSFIGRKNLDEKLVVRSAACSALMPMMQFSVAPWRVLNEANLAAVKKMVAVRKKYVPYIMEQAKSSAISGEPIVRTMEYEFPNQGMAEIQDQFMLGKRYMVAPVVTKENTRKIHLPKGVWKSDAGKIIRGPKIIEENVSLDRLPVFELIKK